MQVFKIRQDGIKEIRKKQLLRSIPLLVIAAAVGIAISTINTPQKEGDVNVLPIMIPIVALALGFGIYRGMNRQTALLESYSLTITNNLITREQLNTPRISIYFNDIKEIVKQNDGNFIIQGRESADLIGIPVQIEHYEQLEARLAQIHTIVVKNGVSLIGRYQSMTGLITVGLMLCVYTLQNKIVVGLTGAALTALLIWSFFKIRRSKNVDNRTRQIAWWVVLILASVLAVMYFKLTGYADTQNIH